jgi:hypothetical protein
VGHQQALPAAEGLALAVDGSERVAVGVAHGEGGEAQPPLQAQRQRRHEQRQEAIALLVAGRQRQDQLALREVLAQSLTDQVHIALGGQR